MNDMYTNRDTNQILSLRGEYEIRWYNPVCDGQLEQCVILTRTKITTR